MPPVPYSLSAAVVACALALRPVCISLSRVRVTPDFDRACSALAASSLLLVASTIGSAADATSTVGHQKEMPETLWEGGAFGEGNRRLRTHSIPITSALPK